MIIALLWICLFWFIGGQVALLFGKQTHHLENHFHEAPHYSKWGEIPASFAFFMSWFAFCVCFFSWIQTLYRVRELAIFDPHSNSTALTSKLKFRSGDWVLPEIRRHLNGVAKWKLPEPFFVEENRMVHYYDIHGEKRIFLDLDLVTHEITASSETTRISQYHRHNLYDWIKLLNRNAGTVSYVNLSPEGVLDLVCQEIHEWYNAMPLSKKREFFYVHRQQSLDINQIMLEIEEEAENMFQSNPSSPIAVSMRYVDLDMQGWNEELQRTQQENALRVSQAWEYEPAETEEALY